MVGKTKGRGFFVFLREALNLLSSPLEPFPTSLLAGPDITIQVFGGLCLNACIFNSLFKDYV